MKFPNDEARRAYFLEKLAGKAEGPRISEDRRLSHRRLTRTSWLLSDPPYYTACPNPFLEEFVRLSGKPTTRRLKPIHRDPFATDVSEGKNDPIYNAHSYHTKVPHKAIMRYILHYTEPGDLVFDGFCGTGMTGVAAQLCGDRAAIQALGYTVEPDGTLRDADGLLLSRLGSRQAILADLSPAASFIARTYNTPVDLVMFDEEANRILTKAEADCGWLYLTLDGPKPAQIDAAIALLKAHKADLRTAGKGLPWGRINYTVWSDVFVCSECSSEVVFWDAAVDKKSGEVRDEFACPQCSAQLSKRNMERAFITVRDTGLGSNDSAGKTGAGIDQLFCGQTAA